MDRSIKAVNLSAGVRQGSSIERQPHRRLSIKKQRPTRKRPTLEAAANLKLDKLLQAKYRSQAIHKVQPNRKGQQPQILAPSSLDGGSRATDESPLVCPGPSRLSRRLRELKSPQVENKGPLIICKNKIKFAASPAANQAAENTSASSPAKGNSPLGGPGNSRLDRKPSLTVSSLHSSSAAGKKNRVKRTTDPAQTPSAKQASLPINIEVDLASRTGAKSRVSTLAPPSKSAKPSYMQTNAKPSRQGLLLSFSNSPNIDEVLYDQRAQNREYNRRAEERNQNPIIEYQICPRSNSRPTSAVKDPRLCPESAGLKVSKRLLCRPSTPKRDAATLEIFKRRKQSSKLIQLELDASHPTISDKINILKSRLAELTPVGSPTRCNSAFQPAFPEQQVWTRNQLRPAQLILKQKTQTFARSKRPSMLATPSKISRNGDFSNPNPGSYFTLRSQLNSPTKVVEHIATSDSVFGAPVLKQKKQEERNQMVVLSRHVYKLQRQQSKEAKMQLLTQYEDEHGVEFCTKRAMSIKIEALETVLSRRADYRKKELAATKIQRWFRGKMRDGYVTKRMRMEKKAVLIIQRKIRVQRFRRLINLIISQKKDRAVVTVQKYMKGFLVWNSQVKPLSRLRADLLHEHYLRIDTEMRTNLQRLIRKAWFAYKERKLAKEAAEEAERKKRQLAQSKSKSAKRRKPLLGWQTSFRKKIVDSSDSVKLHPQIVAEYDGKNSLFDVPNKFKQLQKMNTLDSSQK